MLKQLASRPSAFLQRMTSTRNTHPPHVFDQITDILAELALEDLKQFPQIPTCPCIDRTREPENTVPLT